MNLGKLWLDLNFAGAAIKGTNIIRADEKVYYLGENAVNYNASDLFRFGNSSESFILQDGLVKRTWLVCAKKDAPGEFENFESNESSEQRTEPSQYW
jgi:hypothetical protein